jgi:putative DNA primase/helicase
MTSNAELDEETLRHDAAAHSRAARNEVVTEDYAAKRFVERHGEDLRYCHSTGAWFRWNTRIWAREETGLAF